LQLSEIEGVSVYGPTPDAPLGRAALATFNVAGIHPTDLSTILDQSGIAVRSGHLCTQPLHQVLGVSASIRASPYIYNTKEDIDKFISALRDSIDFFREMGM
jgi:cysteine desulfurase/selenocysteine lyase